MNIIDDQILSLVSATTSATSEAIDIRMQLIWAIQFVWGGDLTGTVYVEASNNKVNWSMVTGASQATNGTPGSFLANNNILAGYKFVRASFEYVSGSGDLNVWICTKGG